MLPNVGTGNPLNPGGSYNPYAVNPGINPGGANSNVMPTGSAPIDPNTGLPYIYYPYAVPGTGNLPGYQPYQQQQNWQGGRSVDEIIAEHLREVRDSVNKNADD